MTRKVTIAAIQLPHEAAGESEAEKKRCRVTAIEKWLHAAGEANADLACLGEMCSGRAELEDAYTGPTTRMVQELARQYSMHVVLPILARVEGVQRNVALMIDDQGAIAGHYLKVHPTRKEMQKGTVAGDDFPVFDLPFGKVGVCICHDLSFPESTRVLALRGAEIVVWPTLWSGWGEELCYAVIKSRAIDNGVWLATASFGIPQDRAWQPGMILGRSGVIGPDGQVLSSAGRSVGMSVNTVDLDCPRVAHSFSWPEENDFWTSVLADRRPDAYAPLTDPDLVIEAVPPGERTVHSVRHTGRSSTFVNSGTSQSTDNGKREEAT